MHTHVHCCTVHGSQCMETTLLSINRGLGKKKKYKLSIHRVLAFKEKEALPFTTIWMNLVDTKLSKISQSLGKLSTHVKLMQAFPQVSIANQLFPAFPWLSAMSTRTCLQSEAPAPAPPATTQNQGFAKLGGTF